MLAVVRPTGADQAVLCCSGVYLHAGGMRQLHWHLNFDEWQYVINVSVQDPTAVASVLGANPVCLRVFGTQLVLHTCKAHRSDGHN